MDIDRAVATQLANIEKRTGKTLAQLGKIVNGSQLTKHGELVAMLKIDLGMGHGDANALVHHVRKSDGASAAAEGSSTAEVTDAIYTGPKAALRPIHDALMTAITKLGPFEIAPKKSYLSLRGKKQFAMIGPGTNTRVDVGLNMKDVKGTSRLEEQKPGGMCQFKVKLTTPDEVDKELIGWIRQAYDSSIS